MDPKVSIVVLTKNAGSSFQKTLNLIYKQQLKPLETIVIDSGSTDETIHFAQKYPVRLIQIQPEEFGHGRTRNLGGRLAKGEFLVFLTQDAVPVSEDWLATLVKPLMEERRLAGVYGRQIPQAADPFETFALTYTYPPNPYRRKEEDLPHFSAFHILFSNVNSAVKKETWQHYPFSEQMIMCEDQDWAARVLRGGYEILYEPEAAVYHSHRYGPVKLFKRSFDTGLSFKEISRDGVLEAVPKAAAYLRSELHFLSTHSQRRFIPLALPREAIRVFGFLLGRLGKSLPLGLQRRLSLHRGYWYKADMGRKSDFQEREAPMEFVHCGLCSSADSEGECVARDEMMNRGRRIFRIVRCRRCGFKYLNPRPSAAAWKEIYPENYTAYITAVEKPSVWMKVLLDSVSHARVRRIMRYQRGGRILDVGCSTGEFLHRMRSLGNWEVQGLEPNPTAARHSRERLGLPVLEGKLQEVSFPEGRCDVITLWDVLEHLPDLKDTLIRINSWLKQDGLLVLSVPNIDSFEYGLFRSRWYGLDPPRHFSNFSIRTLSKLLEERGFRVLAYETALGSSYQNFLMSCWYWLRRGERRREGKPASLVDFDLTFLGWIPISLLTVLLTPLFLGVNAVKRGSELFVYARKIR